MIQPHLAEFNIGFSKYPLEDPRMAGYVNNFDAVCAIVDSQPDLIWRPPNPGEEGHVNHEPVYEDPKIIIGMSVWVSVKAMLNFVYRTDHMEFLKRRYEFFEEFPTGRNRQAMWWVTPGTIPSPSEGRKRLDYLDVHGPSSYAFTHKDDVPMEVIQ